jgi:ubiquinone biosynthesis protein
MSLSIAPKHVKRYGELARLLIRHGRSDIVKRAGLDAVVDGGRVEEREIGAEGDLRERAESLTEELERLGPTYVKLGQLLATRVDLLPPPYTESLARLQDDVEPFGFDTVEEVVSAELGVRLSKAFRSFDPEPVASASLSQVHRGELRDGREVAVKVQRPGIREVIRDDLDALRELAEFLDDHSDRAHRYRLGDILEQFRRSLILELDFRNEARNLETLGENLASEEGIVVPQPVMDYTTSRVLTMELIRGTKVTALSPVALLEIDREGLGETLFRAYLHQILIDGFFHADPHPGNVFITDDRRIALLDLGQTATLTPGTRDELTKLLLAVAEGRADEAATLLVDLGDAEDRAEITAFKDAVGELVLRSQGRTTGEIALGAIVLQLVRLAGEHGIRPPPELTMLGKTLINLDEVGRALDPELDPNAAIRRHALELTEHQMMSSLSPSSMLKAALEANELVQQMPGRLNRLMELLAENRLTVGVDAIDEVRLIAGLEKIANRITLGLVIAALIVGAAMLVGVDGGPRLLGYPALSLILFLAATVAGVTLALQIVLKDRE